MVRSNKQSTKEFPFFANQHTNTKTAYQQPFEIDSADRILSRFAIAFFGIILLLISFDSSPNYLSSFSQEIKKGSVAKIATANMMISIPERKVEIKKAKTITTPSKVTAPKNIKEPIVAKPVFVSNDNLRAYDAPTTIEIVRTTNSYASKPIAINRAPVSTTVSKPYIKKVVKKENKTIATKKAAPSKITKRVSPKNKLVINHKITEDLLPASFFSAKQKSNQEGKPMLIKFGAKWCLPCREMENSTFKNPQVLDFMKSNYVTLTIDVDDFDGYNMKSYYNISALPTMLVFDAQGDFLAKYVNSMSTSKFMNMLKEHQSITTQSQPIVNTKPTEHKKVVPTQPIVLASAEITQVVAKKRNGQSIQNLKGKAKNWRSTSLEFKTKHLTTGQLIVNIRNLTSGEILNKQLIPLAPALNVGAITDTTISNYQLDISHEKKKDKSGEYAIEIYHASPSKVRLIGKTSFLKDGQFIWQK